MNHEAEKEEIKPLIFNYVFNSILVALILAMHLIIYTWIFWIFSSLAKLFLLGAYLNILDFIFPTCPLIIIFKKNNKVKIIDQIKLLLYYY